MAYADAVPGPSARERTGATRGAAAGEPRHAEQDADGAHPLVCAACGTVVTDRRHRIEVGGLHLHRFTNPDGIEFTFGCYAQAPGAAPVGEATTRWTWFPGCAWRIALCRGCGTHLGWDWADPAGGHFHGLIAERLVEPG